ncbi:hypothetical protein DFH08DRAFT_807092 [Mycena albidolilacea]|uniref:Uncharacterized protein n=1 Tax=Mycena albidolilacea TaxID=1033008 RepID=A0AAD7A5A8_9AGAR|nr:hypothetical protein DFH08DRAFT_807092 [Mycena albidolilacea]
MHRPSTAPESRVGSDPTRPSYASDALHLIAIHRDTLLTSSPSLSHRDALNSCPMQLKAPFVDSSNRMPFTANPKHHTHLRSSSAPPLRKSPPTCTVSLASITADLIISLELPATMNFPLSAPCSSFLLPKHGAPVRASSLKPPRRAYPPKSRAARVSIPKQPPSTSPSGAALSTSTSPRTPTTADLRLASLLARSIAIDLARLHANLNTIPEPSPLLSDLEQPDLLLCERLQTLHCILTGSGCTLAERWRGPREARPSFGEAPRLTSRGPRQRSANGVQAWLEELSKCSASHAPWARGELCIPRTNWNHTCGLRAVGSSFGEHQEKPP